MSILQIDGHSGCHYLWFGTKLSYELLSQIDCTAQLFSLSELLSLPLQRLLDEIVFILHIGLTARVNTRSHNVRDIHRPLHPSVFRLNLSKNSSWSHELDGTLGLAIRTPSLGWGNIEYEKEGRTLVRKTLLLLLFTFFRPLS